MNQKEIDDLIIKKDVTVGIIGLGYVGLPLALRFSSVGFKTIGIDIDLEKINNINHGKSYLSHINENDIVKGLNEGFRAYSNFDKIKQTNIIIICVPTPLKSDKMPDLSFISNTMKSLNPFFKHNQLLILESTTYPGATEEEIVGYIDKMNNYVGSKSRKLNIGENFFVGYSPEREDPGNNVYSIQNIPKIVSGHTARCASLTQLVYDQITNKTVMVSSTRVAEMVKIVENTYRSINIGLVNELKMIADKINIDIYEVIEAASTKPFGFHPHYPGPGLGGHCIPIDPYFLSWKANQFGIKAKFVELAGEINTKIIDYIIKKTISSLKMNNKNIEKSKILILGLSYKKNINDLRESPSLELIDKLKNKKNASVHYSDPFFSRIPKTRKYDLNMKSVKISSDAINKYDVVILMTDHDNFDYSKIKKNSKILIDTRGKYKVGENVIRA